MTLTLLPISRDLAPFRVTFHEGVIPERELAHDSLMQLPLIDIERDPNQVKYRHIPIIGFMSRFFNGAAIGTDGLDLEMRPKDSVLDPSKEPPLSSAFLECLLLKGVQTCEFLRTNNEQGIVTYGLANGRGLKRLFIAGFDGGIKGFAGLVKVDDGFNLVSLHGSAQAVTSFAVVSRESSGALKYSSFKRGVGSAVEMDEVQYAGAEFVYGRKGGDLKLYHMTDDGLKEHDLKGRALKEAPEETYYQGIKLALRYVDNQLDRVLD